MLCPRLQPDRTLIECAALDPYRVATWYVWSVDPIQDGAAVVDVFADGLEFEWSPRRRGLYRVTCTAFDADGQVVDRDRVRVRVADRWGGGPANLGGRLLGGVGLAAAGVSLAGLVF